MTENTNRPNNYRRVAESEKLYTSDKKHSLKLVHSTNHGEFNGTPWHKDVVEVIVCKLDRDSDASAKNKVQVPKELWPGLLKIGSRILEKK